MVVSLHALSMVERVVESTLLGLLDKVLLFERMRMRTRGMWDDLLDED